MGNRIGRPESAVRAVLAYVTVVGVAILVSAGLFWLAVATQTAP